MSIHIILDSNIVWNDPSILEADLPNVRLFIPESVLEELLKRRDKDRVNRLWNIFDKVRSRIVILPRPTLNTDALEDVRMFGDVDAHVLHSAIEHAKSARETASEVILATDDSALRHRAGRETFLALSYSGLKDFLKYPSGFFTAEAALKPGKKSLSKDYVDNVRRQVYWAFLASISSSILTWIALSDQGPDAGTILKTGIILFSVVGGPMLYFMRCRKLLYYAGIETAVGFTVALIVIWNDLWTTQTILQLIGGLYIIVRGMDNIDKATEGDPFNVGWRALFRGTGRELADAKVRRR